MKNCLLQRPFHDSKAWLLSESGIIDMFLFSGADAHEVLFKYHCVTGFPAVMPMFSLGKHQSRWNYRDQDDVRERQTYIIYIYMCLMLAKMQYRDKVILIKMLNVVFLILE
jgi:hypothetical protein